MLKLIQSGLFGGHLFHVATKELVERYNACLEDIGLERTALERSSTSMDGAGARRSPRSGRTSSTSRTGAPIRIRSSSRRTSNRVHCTTPTIRSTGTSITRCSTSTRNRSRTSRRTDCGLWFALDQDISAYRSPQDLLMVDVVKVQFKTVGNLITAAREQRELVRTYFDKPMAWADRELRREDQRQRLGTWRPAFPKSGCTALPLQRTSGRSIAPPLMACTCCAIP
jgi:hypothetical protein